MRVGKYDYKIIGEALLEGVFHPVFMFKDCVTGLQFIAASTPVYALSDGVFKKKAFQAAFLPNGKVVLVKDGVPSNVMRVEDFEDLYLNM